jgi:hypothetical protein
MTVTRDFKELVQKRVSRDPAFADALLREGIDTMLSGDVDTGKVILRDYIKATVGFEARRGDRHAGEKPYPHARPARQSASTQSLQHPRLPAETGGPRITLSSGAWLMPKGTCLTALTVFAPPIQIALV